MKIKTEFVYPPIPDRSMDWSAVDDDTYDGPGCRGATEEEAIKDLKEKLGIDDDEPQNRCLYKNCQTVIPAYKGYCEKHDAIPWRIKI